MNTQTPRANQLLAAQLAAGATGRAAAATLPPLSLGAIIRAAMPENMVDPNQRKAHKEELASAALGAELGLAARGTFVALYRDMTAAGVSGSQYLVGNDPTPGELFIDALRNISLLSSLAITPVGPLKGTGVFPRVASGAPTSWINAEGTTLIPQDVTFGQLEAQPKTVGTLLGMTRVLRMQLTPAAEQFIVRELAGGIAEAVDAAMIAGTGVAGQPTGLLKRSGIGSQSGTSLAWAGIVAMIGAVETSKEIRNRAALAWLAAPDVAELLRKRQRFTGVDTPILDDGKIAGFPATVSSAAPAGTLIFGDWSRLWLADWGVLDIGSSDAHDVDFRTGLRRLRALFVCDVLCAAPTAFCVAQSIT